MKAWTLDASDQISRASLDALQLALEVRSSVQRLASLTQNVGTEL